MRTVACSPVPRVLVVGLLAVLCSVGLLATPAQAEDRTVEVSFEGYAPAKVTVGVGDTVTWVWETGGHSVTHRPDDGQQRAFDSHPRCDAGLEAFRCGGRGEEFSHQFDRAGTYRYFSRMDEEVRGTVVVEPEPTSSPSPSPSPTPTGLPSPTEDPTEDPEPSESPEPSSEPESDESTSDEPESEDPESDEPASNGADADEEDEATSPPRRSSSQRLSADTSREPRAGAPEVATRTATDDPFDRTATPAEEPSFDDFPEGSDPSAEDVPGEVAIGDSGGDDDTARLVWGVLGGVTLLGTVGAFSRTVLFGEDWSAGS